MKLVQEIDALQQKINALPLISVQRASIKQYYRIHFTYSSNALEGNSLTESETKVVLENGLTVDGKPLVDHLEALGHSNAYDFLYALTVQKGFTQDQIKKFHHLFYYRIDEQHAGVYRNVQVAISGSEYPLSKPNELDHLMQACVAHYGAARYDKHPVEWAALTHKEFVFIHPFIDGNGRVARLLMNLVLLQAGYCIAIIPPILRREYIASLEKAHVDDRDFIEFIARNVKESQQDYLRLFG